MKVKELKKTVNVSWSPCDQFPVMLATGSSAQQVDASFSSSSHLELYSMNFEDPGYDLDLKSSLQTQHKFQKIVWSGAGTIVGGCDGGLLEFYNVDNLLNNPGEALVASSNKHSGNVSALDINPYQKNLLASGASDSEVFIWDLNNTTQPMAPGNKSQPFDHVQGLAWNQQVQHILGTTFSTRCVVLDLRKNEPIMKLSDSESRTRWRSLAWHPDVATQLCLASEDDQHPVVQIWDLRLAASPLATLQRHDKGVLSVAWSKRDASLLLSAGKDGRVLLWDASNNTPGGELLAELSHQNQWVFDVQWCPRDPNLVVTTSFDQEVSIHALLGGSRPEGSTANTANIMDSFGGLAGLSALPAVARTAPAPLTAPAPTKAPAWLKRPSRAKFGFGGKLITFERCPQEASKVVYVSQVVSEFEIVERSTELDLVLNSTISNDPSAAEMLAEYCRQKGDAATDQKERYTWFYLRANFLPTFREEVLDLLGFKQEDIQSKFKSNAISGDGTQNNMAALSRGESTETDAELSTDTSTDLSDAHTLIERKLANIDLGPTVTNVVIPNGDDATSQICRALVCGNLEEAVELCLENKRIADALIIASLGSQDLLYKVQKYHLHRTGTDPVSLISSSILQSKWEGLVQSASVRSYKETLATLLTHCDTDNVSRYCEMLGDKLSKESDKSLSEASTVCYLVAMSVDRLARQWSLGSDGSPGALLALVERGLVAGRAARARHANVQGGGMLDAVLTEYASRLAAQGCLQSARHAISAAVAVGGTGGAAELARRLNVALDTQPRRDSQAHSYRAAPTHAHTRPRHDLYNTYNSVPAHEPQSWQQASVPSMASQNSFYQQAPPAPSGPPGPPQAPQAPSVLQPQVAPPPPMQPARPASTGPSSGGITSRSKYKLDPSVQSTPLYNQYNFNNPAPTYNYNQPLNDQYNTSASNYANNTQLPPVVPLNPVNTGNPVNSMNNGYYNPGQTAPVETVPQASRPVQPGWNDPPMLTSKPKQKPQEPSSQAPITHPLFGVEPPQHVPLTGQYPGQYQGLYQGQYQGQQPGQYQGQYEQQVQYQNVQPTYTPQQQAGVEPAAEPAVVEKPPLAAEHRALQHALDTLREQCLARANNPQMKRKLEDVQRRLETLYDMLRDYRLSESTIQTLHACAQCCQNQDLQGALHTATSLASAPDFASVASFLPALKVLFQLANQLQVFVR